MSKETSYIAKRDLIHNQKRPNNTWHTCRSASKTAGKNLDLEAAIMSMRSVCVCVCVCVCVYIHTYYVLINPPIPIHYVLAAVFASCFYVLKSLLQE